MRLFAWVISWVLSLAVAVSTQAPARFDLQVRSDFFAGFAGDTSRLEKAMAACERALASDPKHAEALVWHGSGLAFQAGTAFQRGDRQSGMELWTRGLSEMDQAVALAPDHVGVRIPRGAMLITATRNMPPDVAKPLLQSALADYERTLELQSASGVFATLGDHPKGELLFGLAEGYSRLGQTDKARTYFERLVKDAPGSGQTPKAREWLANGALAPTTSLGCVGCHK
jgi:tetratricopeptide (TPR) repeat protein